MANIEEVPGVFGGVKTEDVGVVNGNNENIVNATNVVNNNVNLPAKVGCS